MRTMKRALILLLAGGLFGLGFVLVLAFVDYAQKPSWRTTHMIYAPAPPSSIVEHRIVPEAEYLTISGTIKNIAWDRWDFVDVYAYLYVDETRIRECVDAENRELRPGEQASFKIVCPHIATKNLSPKIRYELTAVRGLPRTIEK
jgi:hypothetical protein